MPTVCLSAGQSQDASSVNCLADTRLASPFAKEEADNSVSGVHSLSVLCSLSFSVAPLLGLSSKHLPAISIISVGKTQMLMPFNQLGFWRTWAEAWNNPA